MEIGAELLRSEGAVANRFSNQRDQRIFGWAIEAAYGIACIGWNIDDRETEATAHGKLHAEK